MSEKPQIPARAVFNGSFFGIIAWIVGVAMTGIGGHELLTSLRCGDAPTAMTVAELAHQGPKMSDFVTLTDFEPNWDGYVTCQDEDGRWTTADVPLRPAGSAAPPRVLIRVRLASSEEELRNRLAGQELSGVITGRGLFGEFGGALAAGNPGIDPAACWIVTLGKSPLDVTMLSAVFVGGISLFTLSMFLFVYARPKQGPEQAVLRAMSPLLLLVEGLHALADFLPSGSRRACGMVLFPPTAALAAWGGYQLWDIAQIGVTEAGVGIEILAIIAVDFGVSLALVALSFLLVEPPPEPEQALGLPGAHAELGT
jgi:hypothetical protein